MKKTVIFLLAATWVVFGFSAHAEDDDMFDAPDSEDDEATDEDDSGPPPESAFVSTETQPTTGEASSAGSGANVIGGHLMLGFAGMSEDWGDVNDDTLTEVEFRARFAGGLGFFFQHWFTDMVAINGGLDLVGKGYKTHYEEADMDERGRLRHLEIPLGIRLKFNDLRVGFDLAFSFAVYGEYWRKSDMQVNIDGDTEEIVREVHFMDSDWEAIRRFNINPRLSAGYGIPVGNVHLVPGFMFEFELLNTAQGDLWEDNDVKQRFINFMLTAGVEYGL